MQDPGGVEELEHSANGGGEGKNRRRVLVVKNARNSPHQTGGLKVRKLVISTYMTLDGVMEAPENWELWSDEHEQYAWEQLLASDALLMGRKVYEVFAGSWPSRDGEFADRMNGLPKFVVSFTLEEAEWNNTTVISGNVPEEVGKLKQQPGQQILMYGSGDLMHTLRQHGLVDEYRIWLNPLVLGSGKRLFPEGTDQTALRLVDTRVFGTGVTVLSYQPAEGQVGS
jgi:dihydrofolate reductase